MKSKIFFFVKEHRFLYIPLTISILIAVFSYLFFCFFYLNSYLHLFRYLIFFIPCLLVIFVAIISKKIYSKHPKITKFVSVVLNLFIIFVFQILTFVVFWATADMFSDKEPIFYKNIDNYKEAINSIKAQKCIEHFPKTIPDEAHNIQFNKENNSWFGSEAITLKFDINKKYIENELKKYKFNYKENINGKNLHKIDAMMTDNGRIKPEGFTLYVINDRESEAPKQNSFPYHYGIAVNKESSQIIYYYTCPD